MRNVYERVMEEAQPLNVVPGYMDAYSEVREAMTDKMGIVPTPLEESKVERHGFDMRGHSFLMANTAVLPTANYKVLGMSHAVLVRPPARVYHVASAGNAALGLAHAAVKVGANVEVECVEGMSKTKYDKLVAMGVKVNAVHPKLETGMVVARKKAERPGHAYVHPFDQLTVATGHTYLAFQALAGLLERQAQGSLDLQRKPVQCFVQVGGGGLLVAFCSVVRWAKDAGLVGEREIDVIGVQMRGTDAGLRYRSYMNRGEKPPQDLFAEGLPFNPHCDGLAVRALGKLAKQVIVDRRMVYDAVSVGPDEVGEAMAVASVSYGIDVEPAAAVGLAAARKYALDNPAPGLRRADKKRTLVAFITGANTDAATQAYFADAAQAGAPDAPVREVKGSYATGDSKPVPSGLHVWRSPVARVINGG